MIERVLVAGVGNLFFRDDGFGVELVRRLLAAGPPPGVRVIDFGTGGLHLAYEITSGAYERVIIADAMAGGSPPGTVYVAEPDLAGGSLLAGADAHSVDLPAVFAAARALGGPIPPVTLIGCEPADVEPGIGLSAPVEAALGPAVERVLDQLRRAAGHPSAKEAAP